MIKSNYNIVTILCLTLFSFLRSNAQDFGKGDSLIVDAVIFQGGGDLTLRDGTPYGKSYQFLDSTGNLLVVDQLGKSHFGNIAILGFSNSCVCIGDTVTLRMWTIIDPPNGERRQIRKESMFKWFQRWGKLKIDGHFVCSKHYRNSFLKRNSWFNFTGIFRQNACFIEVVEPRKFYTHHGSAGDHCASCKKWYSIDVNEKRTR
jgi:hypothetical protein